MVMDNSSWVFRFMRFEPSYKLKPLSEVEHFVKTNKQTNKHLPDMPSACDVEKEGVDMVKMDAKPLFQKVKLVLLKKILWCGLININRSFYLIKPKRQLFSQLKLGITLR